MEIFYSYLIYTNIHIMFQNIQIQQLPSEEYELVFISKTVILQLTNILIIL